MKNKLLAGILSFSIILSFLTISSNASNLVEDKTLIEEIDNKYYYLKVTDNYNIALCLDENYQLSISYYLRNIEMKKAHLDFSSFSNVSAFDVFNFISEAILKNQIQFQEVISYQQFQATSNVPVYSINDVTPEQAMDELEACFGETYSSRLLVHAIGPQNAVGKLYGALTYYIEDVSDGVFMMGSAAIDVASYFGIPIAQVLNMLDDALVDDFLIHTLQIKVYYADIMWTKTVYVNDTYQYYAGKEEHYALGCVLNYAITEVMIRLPDYTQHPDFDDNDALLTAGFNNYFS